MLALGRPQMALASLAVVIAMAVAAIAVRASQHPREAEAEPPQADVMAILSVDSPQIQGNELYDQAFARSVVERADAILNQIDQDDVPPPAAFVFQNAKQELLTARDLLNRGDFTEAVRFSSQAEAAAHQVRFVIQAESEPLPHLHANASAVLTELSVRREEQEATVLRLESAVSTISDYLLLVSIENQLRDTLREQVAYLWEQALKEADDQRARRLAGGATGTLTLLSNHVERVDYLLTRLQPEDPHHRVPVSSQLASWVSQEMERVLAEIDRLERLYPEDTTLAHRTVRGVRSQVDLAQEEFLAGWTARAWNLVISARAGLDAVSFWALLPAEPTERTDAVPLNALAYLRAQVLGELSATAELKARGSTHPLTDLPWFTGHLKEATHALKSGDDMLRRYAVNPSPELWADLSREVCLIKR